MSKPKSHKTLTKVSIFWFSVGDSSLVVSKSRSISEKGCNSPLPYPPTAKIPNLLMEVKPLFSDAAIMRLSIFSDLLFRKYSIPLTCLPLSLYNHLSNCFERELMSLFFCFCSSLSISFYLSSFLKVKISAPSLFT